MGHVDQETRARQLPFSRLFTMQLRKQIWRIVVAVLLEYGATTAQIVKFSRGALCSNTIRNYIAHPYRRWRSCKLPVDKHGGGRVRKLQAPQRKQALKALHRKSNATRVSKLFRVLDMTVRR